ncbi:MAG: DegV family protein [Clostridiales bacterium]|nr:DegV family protein [Clostridiales bacterium]
MGKIIITSDSTCDLSQDLINNLDIRVIPLYVNIGDESFKDGVEISPEEVFKSYEENDVLAKTSAIPIYDFKVFFEDLLDQGYEIIHFSISSLLSSSHQNAVNAANMLDTDKISLIDSLNLSTGIGLQVIRAAELAKQGLTRQEIVDDIAAYSHKVNSSFVIDSLNYLWKGGRCSAVSAFGANLIKIKPCIEVTDGTMKVGKKYRGSLERSLKAYVDDRLKDIESIDPKRIFVTNTVEDKEITNRIIEMIKDRNYFEEILTSTAGCTISCHCGPNTLGIIYINK